MCYLWSLIIAPTPARPDLQIGAEVIWRFQRHIKKRSNKKRWKRDTLMASSEIRAKKEQ